MRQCVNSASVRRSGAVARRLIACAMAYGALAGVSLGDEPGDDKAKERSVEQGAMAAGAPVQAGALAMTLLLSDGSTEPVSLTGLNIGTGVGEDVIAYVDRAGKAMTRPASEVLAVLPEWWTIAGLSPGPVGERAIGQTVLDLSDGQRLIGKFAPTKPSASVSADRVEWVTARFGRFSVPLDHLTAWSARGVWNAVSAPTADRVRLSNGDVLEGVIDRIDKVVVLAPATVRGAKSAMIPIENIESLVLANPARARGNLYGWLSDGSVVRLSRVQGESDGERIRLVAAGGIAPAATVTLRANEVLAIATAYSRIRALGTLEFGRSIAKGGLVYAAPVRVNQRDGDALPVLGAPDVLLPSPMQVEGELPEGAQVLTGLAEMPESGLTWGDCELVISVVGTDGQAREVDRQRLSAQRSSVMLKVRLGAKPRERLRLAVEAGARGPVQDRVLIRRGVLIVGPGKASQ